MDISVQTHNEEETMAAGRALSSRIEPGRVIAIYGDLGTGKTHFVKGFADGLGIPPEQVDSPTFTLLQEYRTPEGLMLYHFDFYRLKTKQEAVEIGTEEYFYGDGISIVEWPDRIEDLLPEEAIRIRMKLAGPNSRSISIEYPTAKAIP